MAEVKFIVAKVEPIDRNGMKFNAYRVVSKGGRLMDCRFVKGCQNVPEKPCVIVCNEDDCNVDTTRMYPILWVKNIIRIEERERTSNVGQFFDPVE